jgi:small neutral amino acid transporter SnatA (MarC family)
MSAEVLSAAFLLLLVLDPFGNLPVVMSSLANVTPARRRAVVLRECVFAYAILLAFMAGGRAFLQFLQLSESSLAIAGGIILFLIALRMVFHHPEGIFGDAPDTEPFLVPLAVPMPGCVSNPCGSPPPPEPANTAASPAPAMLRVSSVST